MGTRELLPGSERTTAPFGTNPAPGGGTSSLSLAMERGWRCVPAHGQRSRTQHIPGGHILRTPVLKGHVTARPSLYTFSWLLAPGDLLLLPTETPTQHSPQTTSTAPRPPVEPPDHQ